MPPVSLIETLQAIRRRIRRLAVLYGVGILVASLVGLLLATVGLDFLLNLPAPPRVALMVIALAAAGYVLARWVIWPAISDIGLSDVAGKLEQAFPQFDDRLRSTVDFASKTNPGSDALKRRVMEEAGALAQRVDLAQGVRLAPVWRSAAAAGAAVVLAGLVALAMGPAYLRPAMSRLLTPFNGRPWPKSVQIQMVADLPARVPVGRGIDVRMELVKGKASKAQVFCQYGDGPVETQIMSKGADGVYSATLDARLNSGTNSGTMKVWVQAGDDTTPVRTIRVVQQLAIAGVELTVTPPPYVKNIPAATVQLDQTPATVTYGSSLSMVVNFNKGIDPAKLPKLTPGAQGGVAPEVKWTTPEAGGTTATATWIARATSTFEIHAIDVDGFGNRDAADEQVIVRPDAMPAVQLTKPAHNDECTAQAVVPLRAIAEDDFGIQSLQLRVVKLGTKPQPLATIDMVGDGNPQSGIGWTALEMVGDTRRWQMDYAWDLSKLANGGLKPGDVIEYWLEAKDNFDFEGKTHDAVDSARYRITILSQSQFTALMNTQMQPLREQVAQAHGQEQGLREQTRDLHEQTHGKAQLDHADKQLAQALIAGQSTTASEIRQVSTKLDDMVQRMQENHSQATDLQQLAADARDELNQVAEQPMKDAMDKLASAAEQKNPDARDQYFDAAQGSQQQASDRLDRLMNKMGGGGGLEQAIEQTRQLLETQQGLTQKSNELGPRNLGKKPDEIDPNDRKQMDANADAQGQLAQQAQALIDGLNKESNKLSKSDPASSQAMQQAAQSGQDAQVSSQMKQASDQQQQNQQAGLQQSQMQAELGLQTMMHELQEAERRKLEALQQQLASMQQQIGALVREQAGLNYDNLSLQGGEVLKKSDAKVVKGLLEDAEWADQPVPATPNLEAQTRLQEQTERNARSVSKAAEALPDGAQITAALNRAGDRMGRAISDLRDDDNTAGTDPQRLARAYDPPQVEALEALREAKAAIDQQAAQNQQALDNRKKDSIRAQYVKILEDQKKIDQETAELDKAPRGDDGQLGHGDAIRLRQLPPRQGTLAERVSKLDSDLTAMGGIVYVWANKDIADSMKRVRADLEKPATGITTQAEQGRIEDQLQAMIDSLKTDPKKSQFAHEDSGGGGGKGGGGSKSPKLPSEAELRLHYQLQQALNKETQLLDQQGKSGDPAVTALGQRQEQLRTLLDQVLTKVDPKLKFGPEPDPSQKLPEEMANDNEDKELEQQLLNSNGQPDDQQVDSDLKLIGDRMAKAQQRLSLDRDPGKTTQEIQGRILDAEKQLIEMARTTQSESKPKPGQPGQPQEASGSPSDQPGQPDNSKAGGKKQQNTGDTPANASTGGHDVSTGGTPTADITQTGKEWGGESPRLRAAITEAASEKPVEKFKQYIDGYYQALGSRATQ